MYSFIFSTSFDPSWYLSFTWCFFQAPLGPGSTFRPWSTDFADSRISQWRTSWRFDVLTTTFEKTWRIEPRLPRTKPSEKPFHTLWKSSVFPTCFHISSTFRTKTWPWLLRLKHMSIIWALYNSYNLKNEVMHMYSRLRERLHQRPMAMAGNVKQLSLANATSETANSC